MELHNLKPAKGSVKRKKRIARGQGSGHGGTSTRGHKGAKSRSGWSSKRAFEGGQMPLQMRLPKRGFKNPNRVNYTALNLARLQEIKDKYGLADVSVEALYEKRIIKKGEKIKVLANGELTSTVNVKVHAISEKAKAAIEAKGGSVTLL
jgi:large subunit ribosomal protein L15